MPSIGRKKPYPEPRRMEARLSSPYDQLLIASGAAPIVPDLPGFDLPGVLALKTLYDGKRIKGFLSDRQVKKVVIIGMGYIALEMAEALRARDIEVAMVKPRPVFLPWLETGMAERVKEEVTSKGGEPSRRPPDRADRSRGFQTFRHLLRSYPRSRHGAGRYRCHAEHRFREKRRHRTRSPRRGGRGRIASLLG